MLWDYENLLSDDQAITGDVASSHYIDLGAKSSRVQSKPEYGVKILVQVTEAFNNLTSLDIKCQSDDNTSFGSPANDKTVNVLLADLVVGKQVEIELPRETQRYLRLYYDVNGSNPSTGKITAGVVTGIQTANSAK